jgi:RNA polymerase sigma-70 factor (ECF subfamily)
VNEPSEREWVRQAQAGNRSAFAVLVDLYWERIRRWIYSLTRQAHLAEDLTQEVFLRAWTGLPNLEADQHFRGWLFSIARNLALDSRKGPRGVPSCPLPDNLPARETGPLTALIEDEGQRLLQAALGRLPLISRAVYLLWTQEDLPYRDIAQAMNSTEEVARWRVCKARQFLLQELAPYLDTPKP